MAQITRVPSARQDELLEAAYRYVLTHGLIDVSLRPLAAAIGSSPRVLLYLFETKDGLVRALLARARADELAMLDGLRTEHAEVGLAGAAARLWQWLSDPAHHDLLTLWAEAYAHGLVHPAGAWSGFADQTVADWLGVLAAYQPPAARRSRSGTARRSAVLAVLRGALLDLLATGDIDRTSAAVRQYLATIG